MIDAHEIATGIHRIALYDETDMADMSPPGVTTNLFVVSATQPAIIQTLPRRTFQRVSDALAGIVDPAQLRYIVVPHHEADSSGALNEWLQVAPDATVLCSQMCAFLNLNDFSDKTPVVVADGETVDLGSHRLRFLATPMVNQWDSMMVFEETTGMLFSNDLFSNLGTEVSTADDLSKQNLEGARFVGYQADDRTAIGRALDKIEPLGLRGMAPMHGPVITGHFDEYVSAFRNNSVAAYSERSALLGPE